MNLIDCWEKAKKLISENAGPAAYEAWISRLQAKEEGADSLSLCVQDEFSKEWIIKHYLKTIENSLEKIAQRKVRIEFIIEPQSIPQSAQTKEPRNYEKNTQTIALNPRYSFDNFVVGPSNRFAHAASLAVAESPAKAYNPLFIYGGVGLGKTHLMQAICHFILQKSGPDIKICYIPSEKFTNELIDAIQHHSTARFRQKYRNTDILVIDDVQFIAGKESTQEEFFHTFNTLYDAHKQIIISSDRQPKDIFSLEERLISRFSWGLVTDIQSPDFETRVAILRKKVEHEPIKVSDDVICYIAELVKSNIRELEGALIRVVAYSLLDNKPIDLDLAKTILKDFIKENTRVINIDLIQKQVSNFFSLPPEELKTTKRNKNIVLARQVAMYLSRELTSLSLPEIGSYFGGKDHTTVLHSYNKIKELVNKNTELKTSINKIIHSFKQ